MKQSGFCFRCNSIFSVLFESCLACYSFSLSISLNKLLRHENGFVFHMKLVHLLPVEHITFKWVRLVFSVVKTLKWTNKLRKGVHMTIKWNKCYSENQVHRPRQIKWALWEDNETKYTGECGVANKKSKQLNFWVYEKHRKISESIAISICQCFHYALCNFMQ